MIPELIYYHGMRTHNLSTGGGTGWAITNLIGGYTVLVIGGLFLFLMLIGCQLGLNQICDNTISNYTLSHHSLSYLKETCNVCSEHIVSFSPIFLGCRVCLFVN